MTRLRCGRNLVFALNRLMENQPRREPSLVELEIRLLAWAFPGQSNTPASRWAGDRIAWAGDRIARLATESLGLATGLLGLATGLLGLATGSLGLATGSLGLAIRAGVTAARRAKAA